MVIWHVPRFGTKIKMKMRGISDLGMRIGEGELRVASGGLRVTNNARPATFLVSREGGLFYRRGAECAEDGPGPPSLWLDRLAELWRAGGFFAEAVALRQRGF